MARKKKGTNRGLYTDRKSEHAKVIRGMSEVREHMLRLGEMLDRLDWPGALFWSREVRERVTSLQVSCQQIVDLDDQEAEKDEGIPFMECVDGNPD